MSGVRSVGPVDLNELMGLDRESLAKRWAAVFGCPAPRKCGSPLLRGALAWHAQMHALRESAGSREVDRMVAGFARMSCASAQVLSPGTRLLREWQGRSHHVTVIANGFEYDGKTYRSLTAIARLITGSAWSGPLFFGLRTR